jgi:hypothetical protein
MLVIKKIVANTAVTRLKKFADPLDPNKLPDDPPPKAAPISAPLPCCINTSPITPRAASTCTTKTIKLIIFRQSLK